MTSRNRPRPPSCIGTLLHADQPIAEAKALCPQGGQSVNLPRVYFVTFSRSRMFRTSSCAWRTLMACCCTIVCVEAGRVSFRAF